MTMGAEYRSKFDALHRQWVRNSRSRRKNLKQSYKQIITDWDTAVVIWISKYFVKTDMVDVV